MKLKFRFYGPDIMTLILINMDELSQNLNYLRILKNLVHRISSDPNLLKDGDFPNYFSDLSLGDLSHNQIKTERYGEILWAYEGYCFEFETNLNSYFMDFISSFRRFIDSTKRIYAQKKYWIHLNKTKEWMELKHKAEIFDSKLNDYLSNLLVFLPEIT